MGPGKFEGEGHYKKPVLTAQAKPKQFNDMLRS